VNVWLITVGEPLPGEASRPWRTGLLCAELVHRGHDVVWWTSTVNHFNKTYHQTSSCEIAVSPRLKLQFLHGPLYTSNISVARFRNHVAIAREFRRIAESLRAPDVIVCSFPTIELSDEAAAYGVRHRVPVLLDVRDLWPDELAVRIPGFVRWIAPIALAPMYRATSRAFLAAKGVIGISRGYLEWGLAKARRGAGAMDSVVPHGYPDPLQVTSRQESSGVVSLPAGVDPAKKIFWFVGTFVGSIDLSTVIEAARLLSGREDIQFVFSGSGEREAEWRRQAADLGNVVFAGWADKGGIAAMAGVAYAGLAAYKRGALMSLTNKIFEYLSFGLPVVLSLPGEAREMMERSGAGIYYEPGDPRSLAAVVTSLCGDPAKHALMAPAARETYELNFSATAVYTHYADLVEAAASAAVPAA
jgi:glycosyltransferase involved in cell wall biosynthesis